MGELVKKLSLLLGTAGVVLVVVAVAGAAIPGELWQMSAEPAPILWSTLDIPDHIVISPSSSSIPAGSSQSYSAEGFDSTDASLGDVTSTTTFSIGPDGSCTDESCTASTPGNHTVTGTNAGQTDSATLNVTAGALDHVVVSPGSATISSGGSLVYTVEGFDSANNSLGNVAATLSISPNGSCGGGSCTATAAGAHTVTGSFGGKSDTASLTVDAGPLDHLVVSPGSATISAGGSQAYTVTGFDSANNSLGNVAATLSISPNGSCGGGSCTATAVGAHTVTGSFGGKSDTASLTVNAGPLDHLVVSPATATITAGGSQAYTTASFDSANNSLGNVAATLSISPDGSCGGGSCTATVPGPHTVTGSFGGKSDTASLTVNVGPLDHIVVSPATATIIAGGSQAYTTAAFDAANNSLGNNVAATLSITPNGSCSGGSCTATVPGAHTVTGSFNGKLDTAVLTVTAVPPVNTVAPVVNDQTPMVAQVLTYTPGTWTGFPPPALTVQWCTPNCGASLPKGSSYTVQAVDVGKQIFVRETAINTAGTVTKDSALTTTAVAGPPVNATGPTINDTTPSLGQTLTGSSGNWTAFPAPTLAHQWQRCNAAGASCVDISGASSSPLLTSTPPATHANTSTYVVSNADLGSTLRLKVTAQNGVAPAPAAVFSAVTQVIQAAPAQVAGQAPAVTGTLARGQTLTASSGKWTGFWTAGQPPVAFTHQWQRCQAGTCVNVNGDAPVAVPPPPGGVATCTSVAPCGGTTTYLLSDADMGSNIRVIVNATNGGGSVTVTSGLTGVVQGAPIIAQVNGAPDPNAFPKINGNPEAGLNVGASSGSWSAFPAVDPATGYAYQWLRCSGADIGSCSPIGGATGLIYAVQGSDVGQRLRVRVTASNGVLPAGVANSDASPPVVANSGAGGSGVDLLLSVKASSSGGKLTYTLTATNAGDKGATGVTINATPPAGTRLVSASAAGGCSGSGPVACGIGGLAPGANGSATIVVEAGATGVVQLSASVSSVEADVNTSNNSIRLSTFLIVVGSSPQGGTGTGTGVAGGSQTASTTSAKKGVALKDVKVKARRVGTTWVAKTTFTLLSGKADLRLVVTKSGSTNELTLLEGSRFGATTVEGSSDEVAFTATKSATFPIKIVLPAKGFSLKQIYVIRITATAPNGAASTLNIGFKGATLVTKRASAKRVGNNVVASSILALPAGASKVSAWVTLSSGVKKLILLKGSRLGTFVAGSVGSQLTLKTGKGGKTPVQILLAPGTLSRSKAYVIRVHAASASGVWTDYELSFPAPSA